MNSVLVLFAHPLFEKSRVHSALVKAVQARDDVVFNDLYQIYPDFNINVRKEQELLAAADVVILQHPIYWYSLPPLLKQYIDMVFEYGWAYGPDGHALDGKSVMSVISSGGTQETYTPDGHHGHTINEFFLPVERTVTLCRMHYLPPFVVHGSHRLENDEMDNLARQYDLVLEGLVSGDLSHHNTSNHDYMNEMIR